ncbi:MAG: DoxX family protein [Phycisphaerales bacterium]|nr:DoxX family protein [Phycisphaerales bacterium]
MDENTLATLNDVGTLVLRIMFAWIFLWPLPGLLRDWPTTVQTTGLLFSRGKGFFTLVSVSGMAICSLMVAIGIYGRPAAIFLFFFCIGGAIVHNKLAGIPEAAARKLPENPSDQKMAAVLQNALVLNRVGNVTSAQKNLVIAGIAAYFVLAGTGSLSLLSFWPAN